ncbi:MAG: DHH family phosphoesterase, partial [Firmicutes bacterium]|nr:DHH family phosphoesterase [Bacillota bacterium]
MAKWVLLDTGEEFDEVYKKAMEDTGYGEIFFTVVRNRGIDSENSMRSYLSPSIYNFSDAKKFKDIGKAMKILKESIEKREKICIYGDFDVDGVCSSTILYKGLKYLGADVMFYIPDRRKEGYGLNIKAVEKIAESGCDVIFTCDNGIAAIQEVRRIKELGMKCIVLDHHEPQFTVKRNVKIDILPEADAIIDAKQQECEFPFKEMCAGGVSYIFMREFYAYMGVKLPNEAEFMVFAMIATICDVVPLKEDNRIIVRNGFKLIRNREGLNKGLDKLTEKLNIKNRKLINEHMIGFMIGPCINSVGRFESAMTAVELFSSEDEDEINEKAAKLVELNTIRKD